MSKSVQSNILLLNIEKGKLGEQIAKEDYENNGFKVVKTGRGSDFIAIKHDEFNKLYVELVEVKTGKAKPSKRQLITMRKSKRKGKIYNIYRVTDVFLENYIKSKSCLWRSLK